MVVYFSVNMNILKIVFMKNSNDLTSVIFCLTFEMLIDILFRNMHAFMWDR